MPALFPAPPELDPPAKDRSSPSTRPDRDAAVLPIFQTLKPLPLSTNATSAHTFRHEFSGFLSQSRHIHPGWIVSTFRRFDVFSRSTRTFLARLRLVRQVRLPVSIRFYPFLSVSICGSFAPCFSLLCGPGAPAGPLPVVLSRLTDDNDLRIAERSCERRSRRVPMSPTNPTELLSNITGGDTRAADELLKLVYPELRQLAQRALRRERPDHTLQATALVHEAYLKLIDQTRVDWQGQTHFKAVAAMAMGRILVDSARARNREKRGGGWRRVTLHDAFGLSKQRELDPVDLAEALETMKQLDARQGAVAEYRLFAGLTSEETARLLDVSTRTVERDWKMARAWLRRELTKGASE